MAPRSVRHRYASLPRHSTRSGCCDSITRRCAGCGEGCHRSKHRGSRRWKRLQRARQKRSLLARRRIRDLRYKGTRTVIDLCIQQQVGTLFIGDPRGVRKLKAGRHHNQRISRWEVGEDLDYLRHKAERAGIVCSTGDERGTSSR